MAFMAGRRRASMGVRGQAELDLGTAGRMTGWKAHQVRRAAMRALSLSVSPVKSAAARAAAKRQTRNEPISGSPRIREIALSRIVLPQWEGECMGVGQSQVSGILRRREWRATKIGFEGPNWRRETLAGR